MIITLVLTSGPTFYIAIVERNGNCGSLSLILGVVQFFISVIAMILFAIMPSSRMFGDCVASKSPKYLASPTFTASYPSLEKKNRIGLVVLWPLLFGCKFSIWTPWRDIYTRLLKRIYTKLLAAQDMEVNYKPKVR